MNRVDPTARVSPEARMGVGNVIGPFAIVGPGVELGDDNWIGAGTVIGAVPEHRDAHHGPEWELGSGESGRCIVGDGNVLREQVIVQRGLREPTIIGGGCFVMAHAYIAHDCLLEDGVILSANVALAGHVTVGRNANLGVGVAVRQFSRVGMGAMVGMGAVVVSNLPSLSMSIGCPARVRGANSRGLARVGMSVEEIDQIDAMLREDVVATADGLTMEQYENRYLELLTG